MKTIQQPVALKLAEVIDAFDQLNESLPLEMLPRLSAELRRLHELAQPEHPEQMARLGWQYVECLACGSEGARAFPKPEQEPVGYVYKETDYLSQDKHLVGAIDDQTLAVGTALYTSPPQRQPLRGEQIYEIFVKTLPKLTLGMTYVPEWAIPIARAIEAAHGIGDKT